MIDLPEYPVEVAGVVQSLLERCDIPIDRLETLRAVAMGPTAGEAENASTLVLREPVGTVMVQRDRENVGRVRVRGEVGGGGGVERVEARYVLVEDESIHGLWRGASLSGDRFGLRAPKSYLFVTYCDL